MSGWAAVAFGLGRFPVAPEVQDAVGQGREEAGTGADEEVHGAAPSGEGLEEAIGDLRNPSAEQGVDAEAGVGE